MERQTELAEALWRMDQAREMLEDCVEHCRTSRDEVESALCKSAFEAVANACEASILTLEECARMCREGHGKKRAA